MRTPPPRVLLALACLAACDRVPPAVAIDPVGEAVRRGPLEIRGTATDEAGLAELTVTVDGGPPVALPVDGPLVYAIDTATLPDGEHRVEIAAVDQAYGKNRASASVTFTSDNSPPVVEIAERSRKTAQGMVLPVFVRSAEPLVDPKVRFLDGERPLYPVTDTVWRALIGVSVKQDPGTFPLVVEAADALGNLGRAHVDVTVAETAFVRGGYVKLSKAQQETQKDDSKQQYDRERREAAWAHVDPVQRWKGPFQRPAEGEISSEFGKFREYSSGVKSHHLGLDVSNEPGTPIYAAAAGEVLVAESLFIMGNHVIVGHGQGVASAYSHLTAFTVEKGQHVEKGDPIGTLGSTGQSTGPHLHWEVVVGGNKISPEVWEAEAFDPPADDVWAPLALNRPAPEAPPAPAEATVPPAPAPAGAETPAPTPPGG